MERLDALVAGLGVLVLGVALAGVLTAGPAGEGGRAFTIAFLEQRQDLQAQRGSIPGDGERELPLRVALANLTGLEFTVRIAGAGPRAAPDRIEVELTDPMGHMETGEATLPGPGGAAEATVTFARDFAPPPASRAVRAGSEASALAQVAALGHSNGTGTWNVRVTVQGGALAAAHAETHTATLEAAGTAFHAVVQPEVTNPR